MTSEPLVLVWKRCGVGDSARVPTIAVPPPDTAANDSQSQAPATVPPRASLDQSVSVTDLFGPSVPRAAMGDGVKTNEASFPKEYASYRVNVAFFVASLARN